MILLLQTPLRPWHTHTRRPYFEKNIYIMTSVCDTAPTVLLFEKKNGRVMSNFRTSIFKWVEHVLGQKFSVFENKQQCLWKKVHSVVNVSLTDVNALYMSSMQYRIVDKSRLYNPQLSLPNPVYQINKIDIFRYEIRYKFHIVGSIKIISK